MSIDLHIHSTYSDGTFTPAELVYMAKRLKLTAIAITDHDTMDGVGEAVQTGKEIGLEVISGIEISAEHQGQHMHILGYFQDPDNEKLKARLKKVQTARDVRNSTIIQKLQGLGIDITSEEVGQISTVGQTGRPHIAQVLVKKKVVKNLKQAFDLYLAKGRAAYAPRFVYSVEEAIKHISAAGGIAVMAHPIQIDRSFKSLPKLLDQLVPMGLKGIETYYPSHTTKMKRQLVQLGEKYGIVLTGGSDYHGNIREDTSLAVGRRLRVPGELLKKMKEKAALPAGVK